MCVRVRYVIWGLIAKEPVHEQTFVIFRLFFVRSLFSSPLNFWSVVRVLSGRINFTAVLCREFNLFLRTSLHPSHTTDEERERERETRERETPDERERRRERERERENV